ncbi:MAG: glutamate formimidoyltransferase [Gemmatimonadota bacterium]|nr:glutamate formimidoyltransferase [Gemmatimonadota bacterium]
MIPVLEAVPNISEGRDRAKVRHLVDLVTEVGVDVLDWSSDADHNRSVLTFIGDPPAVEEAAFRVARFAADEIDMRDHGGIHPRVGALDVLPLVPLHDLEMDDAVRSARRVGGRIAEELDVPVYFYARASTPPGRGLAELRRGGLDALRDGFPEDRRPDLPPGATHPHPTAGVTCVGARPVLLAWNVYVSGVTLDDARRVAAEIRERGGGFPGLRALGLRMPDSGRLQVSMNLEDPARTSPVDVLIAIRDRIEARGGAIEETEIIGMMPDTLVLPPLEDRLHLPDLGPARVLSSRVAEHVDRRARGRTETSDGIV